MTPKPTATRSRATRSRINVRLQPRASRDQIVGWQGSVLRAQVHAPPVEEAANQALIRLLSRSLQVAPRALRIVHGHKHRDKLLEIDGLTLPECELRLGASSRVDNKNRGD